MIFQILDHMTTKISGDLFNLTAHDSGYPYWFPYLKTYLDDIGVETRKVSFEKLDLSKPWILSLAPNGWNWGTKYPGDFLQVFDTEVSNELVNGNGYLIINHEAESFTESFYKDVHRFLSNSKLSPSKVIYMVGAINPEVIYKRFVDKHQIPVDKQIKILSSVHVHRRFDPSYFGTIERNNVKKDKKFLSLNRLPRWHRVMLVSMLSQYNLLDDGYVSLGLHPNDLQDKQFFPDLNKIQKYSEFYPEIMDGFKNLVPKLPLQVDQVNLRENQYHINSLPSIFYDKTYFSLVSSTFALEEQEPCIGFTEKEVKPILYQQPFLMYNLPGALKALRRMGFLSFDRWFDESYDDEVHDLIRLRKLIIEVKRLSSIPDEKWDKMLEEMKPVLLHNYNILLKYNKEHLFFNSDLKNLIHYVA